ncbi:MAG: CD225/dispanin family protein [Thermoguttaceae bacterium]
MFCPKCGMQLPDGSTACPACGPFPAPLQPYQPVMSVPQVPDYLVWSILELIFCCLPFGIVGLVYAVQANSAKTYGHFQDAMQKANTAKKFLIWGIVIWGIGAALYLLYVIIMIIVMVSVGVNACPPR